MKDEYLTKKWNDIVNHPPHYNNNQFGIECIQAIREELTDEEFKGYCKGNVIKYTWRENYKHGVEDLNKASWYLTYMLENLFNKK